MNTDHDCRAESPRAPRELSSGKVRRHAFTRLLLSLLLLVLWAFLTRPALSEGEAGAGRTGQGSGSGQTGQGLGSGQTGRGPGAGKAGQENGAGTARQENQESRQEASAAAHSASHAADRGQQGNAPTAPPDLRPPPRAAGNAPQGGSAAAPNEHQSATKRQTLLHLPAAIVPNGAAGAADAEGESGESGYRGFYGVDVSRRGRVLFLVDTSGSMAIPGPNGTRMEVLKEELRNALGMGKERKGDDASRSGGFIIIGFSHMPYQFPDRGMCRYASRAEMSEAEKFIDRLVPSGGTFMEPAWKRALKAIELYKIKTVYFLTDGEAMDGFSAPALLAMLDRHAPRDLVVHCFAIGPDQRFMEEVAKKRNGRYVHRP